MSRRSGKQQKTGFAVWFVLIGFPVVVLLLVQRSGLADMAIRGLRVLGAIPPESTLEPDVSSLAFSAHAAAVARRPPVRIAVPPPEMRLEIGAPECDWLSGRVSFRVSPAGFRPERTFAAFDIASAVAAGTSQGTAADGGPLFKSWSILTNAADLSWTVGFTGVRPGGTLSLQIAGEKSSVETEPPSLGGLSWLWRNGRLAFAGDKALLGGRPFRRGDFQPPDPASGTPGFRVLALAPPSVWLEIVYDRTSDVPLRFRARWPRVSVGYAERVVRFEGGVETEEGRPAVFPEKDRLVLDRGGVLAPNAVRFRYFAPDGEPPVDVLVLTTH